MVNSQQRDQLNSQERIILTFHKLPVGGAQKYIEPYKYPSFGLISGRGDDKNSHAYAKYELCFGPLTKNNILQPNVTIIDLKTEFNRGTGTLIEHSFRMLRMYVTRRRVPLYNSKVYLSTSLFFLRKKQMMLGLCLTREVVFFCCAS